MSASDILYVDNSTLKAVARCSTEAVVRYILGYTTAEERATLKAGTAFHLAMASHFQGGRVGDALQAFTDEYQAFADEHVPADDRLAYANLVRVIEYWLESHPLHAMPFQVDPAMVEIGFAVPLIEDEQGTIAICGRLDLLPTYQGAVYVGEHKSTGRIDKTWLDSFHLDSQISTYMWGAEQHTSLPMAGAFLNAVEFSRIPSSDRKCATHKVAYAECGQLHANSQLIVLTRTPEQIRQWRLSAIHLAKKFRELKQKYTSIEQITRVRQQGQFNNSCRWCELAPYCRLDRDPQYVANNLVYQPWQPYEHAMQPRTQEPEIPEAAVNRGGPLG